MPELELSSREAKYVVLAVPKLMCGAAVRALVELATLKIENLGTPFEACMSLAQYFLWLYIAF